MTLSDEQWRELRRAAALAGFQDEAAKKWRQRGRVPAEHVLALERHADGAFSRHDLRPDIYPDPSPPKRKRTSNGAEAVR